MFILKKFFNGRSKQKKKNVKGFTLIEMLVVLFIVGIIIAIALPNFLSAGKKAQDKADEANKRLISSQADNYFLEFGQYPSSVEELVKKGYLRSVPKCPYGKGKYVINKSLNISEENRVTCKK